MPPRLNHDRRATPQASGQATAQASGSQPIAQTMANLSVQTNRAPNYLDPLANQQYQAALPQATQTRQTGQTQNKQSAIEYVATKLQDAITIANSNMQGAINNLDTFYLNGGARKFKQFAGRLPYVYAHIFTQSCFEVDGSDMVGGNHPLVKNLLSALEQINSQQVSSEQVNQSIREIETLYQQTIHVNCTNIEQAQNKANGMLLTFLVKSALQLNHNPDLISFIGIDNAFVQSKSIRNFSYTTALSLGSVANEFQNNKTLAHKLYAFVDAHHRLYRACLSSELQQIELFLAQNQRYINIDINSVKIEGKPDTLINQILTNYKSHESNYKTFAKSVICNNNQPRSEQEIIQLLNNLNHLNAEQGLLSLIKANLKRLHIATTAIKLLKEILVFKYPTPNPYPTQIEDQNKRLKAKFNIEANDTTYEPILALLKFEYLLRPRHEGHHQTMIDQIDALTRFDEIATAHTQTDISHSSSASSANSWLIV